jgi:hypothetical protein
VGLRLAWTLDAQKNACGGRSNVMIGYMGSPSSATPAAKVCQKKSKNAGWEKKAVRPEFRFQPLIGANLR